MSDEIEAVRRLIDVSSAGDWEAAAASFSDDVELTVDGVIGKGEYAGRDGVAAWFVDWFGQFEPGYRFEIQELKELRGCVLARLEHHGVGRLSGVRVEQVTANAYEVRDGKIAWMGIFPDNEAAVKAVDERSS